MNKEYAFMYPHALYLDETDCVEFDAGESPGWYSYLSAPGYMDRTEFDGPYRNAFRAIRACCELYDVDVRGNQRCTAE